MRAYTKTPRKQIARLRNWIRKHPSATRHQFVEATGGTVSQFYHQRVKLGLSKKAPHVSEGMVKAHQAKSATPEAPEVKVEQAEGKEDFVHYELDLMHRNLIIMSNRLDQVIKTVRLRETQQKELVDSLLKESQELIQSKRALQKQLSTLSEVINATPV